MAAKKPATKKKVPGRKAGDASRARLENGLTVSQDKFRLGLIEGLDIHEAAKRAGIERRSASRMLGRPEMKAALEEGRKKLEDDSIGTARDIMRELTKIGFADIRQLFTDTGGLIDPLDWNDRIAPAVMSLDVQETYEGDGKNRVWTGYLKKVRLHAKIPALDNLAKMLGAYAAPKEPVGPDGKPVVSRRVIVVVPAKRTEADMEGYGQAIEHAQEAVAIPPALPGPVPDIEKLRKQLRARKK